MKISIIIPIYNVAAYIEQTVFSLINQTSHLFEAVFVNDCTPDNSIDVLKNTLNNNQIQFTYKIIEHNENKGLSSARNTGISHATGDYLLFLDSDDKLFDYSIELFINELNKGYVDIIVGEFFIDGAQRDRFKPLNLNNNITYSQPDIYNSYIQYQWYEMACNKLINRAFLIENNLFFKEGILHEDVLWSYKVAFVLRSLRIIKEPTYSYLIHTNSITGTRVSKRNIDSLLIVLLEIHDMMKARGLYSDYLSVKYIENFKFSILWSMFDNRFDDKYILDVYKIIYSLNNIPISAPLSLIDKIKYAYRLLGLRNAFIYQKGMYKLLQKFCS